MTVTYVVLIDADRDGVNEIDATDDVIAAEWRRGMRGAYAHVAEPTRATITLDDTAKTYTGLMPGDFITIRAAVAPDSPQTRFSGHVEFITVTQRNRVILQAQGEDAWLHTEAVTVAPQTDARADEMIEDLLDAARWPPVVNYDPYIVISLDGQNGIDSGLLIYTPNVALQTQTGKSTFAYVGDTWREGAPMIEAIREVVVSERGRFYPAANGTLIFVNRHYTMLNSSRKATFEGDILTWRWAQGEDMLNRVEVGMVPRRIGPANSVVWRSTQPMRVDAGVTRRVILRYRDDDEKRIGVLDLDTEPSYTATTTDGLVNATNFVRVAVERIGMNAAAVTMANLTTVRLVVNDMELRGTPLYTDDPLIVVAEDGESRTKYGPRGERLWLPAVTDIDEAQAIAEYELGRRKTPQGRATSVTVRASAPDAFEVELFDRIRVIEGHTGHDADYLVCQEHHEMGPRSHTITWALEPVEEDQYLVINRIGHTVNHPTLLIAPF